MKFVKNTDTEPENKSVFFRYTEYRKIHLHNTSENLIEGNENVL